MFFFFISGRVNDGIRVVIKKYGNVGNWLRPLVFVCSLLDCVLSFARWRAHRQVMSIFLLLLDVTVQLCNISYLESSSGKIYQSNCLTFIVLSCVSQFIGD